jgi:exosortase K
MPKYFTVILIFCLGKWWHQTATAEELLFLLAPTDALVSAAIGEAGVWQIGEGYLHPSHSMIINASCTGFNFFVLSFLMLSWLLLNCWKAWWPLVAAFALALPLTILANTSRILTISLLSAAKPNGISSGVWHEVQGAFVYFSILVIVAAVLQRVLAKHKASTTFTLFPGSPKTQA